MRTWAVLTACWIDLNTFDGCADTTEGEPCELATLVAGRGGVAFGADVDVGGIDVAVCRGVFVGGTGVTVGSDVAVGGIRVDVGGTVAVGGIDVSVGSDVGAIVAAGNKVVAVGNDAGELQAENAKLNNRQTNRLREKDLIMPLLTNES